MNTYQKLMVRLANANRWMTRAADRGASLVEYALLVALIAVVCLGAVRAFGQENGGLIEGSADKIVDASGS